MGGAVGEEQCFAWQIGIAGLTVNYTVLHWNGAAWDTEASGTLDEIGADGLYEVKFTPDEAGFWLPIAYYVAIGVRYDFGMIHFIGYGVEQDNYDILSSAVFGSEALKTLIDGIIADIGTFPTANYADLAAYVEDVRTRLVDIVTDTGAIVWGDITGIINDIGVFPTANYATVAAFSEDVRTRLIAIVGDTNEVQLSLADGGFTNLLIDSIITIVTLMQSASIVASTTFTSTAATVNTVTCASLIDRADLYEKMMLVPLDGNQAGQGRYITDYDGTGVLTVVPDWSTDPDAAGAFNFVIVPTPAGFLYEAGKGLSANYDLVNGILVMTRIYNDYDIQAEDAEETIFEYDDAAYIWHPEWLMFHLDEMAAGDTIVVRVYEKDNDVDNAWVKIYDQSYADVQDPAGIYVQLPPVDLAFKVTVEQVDVAVALIDVLFKLYKKS